MREFITLVESYDLVTNLLRQSTPEERARMQSALTVKAAAALAQCAPEDFEKLMIWQTDKFYRVFNALELLDASSLSFLSTRGAALDDAVQNGGAAIAYLVDNLLPEDRLRGVHAAFSALGFVVASPELFVIELAKADDVDSETALGERLDYYRAEGAMLARRLFDHGIARRRSCIWLSGSCTADELRAVAERLEGQPYVGVFRNDVPLDGTTVDVFRSAGKSAPLNFAGS